MFIKDLISQWSASGYTACVSMGLTFVLGRVLGPGKFGSYSYLLTLASFFLILQDGGFKTLIFKEKTVCSGAVSVYENLLLPMALGYLLLITIAGMAVIFIFPFPYKTGLYAAILCFTFQALTGFIAAELKAAGAFSKEALWQMKLRTSGAVGILAVIFFFSQEVWGVFLGWSLGLFFILGFAPVEVPWPRLTGLVHYRKIWFTCLSFMAIDAATVVYYRCDIIILHYITGDNVQVGYYAAACRFLDGVVLLAAPVGMICFRHLRLVWEEKELFNDRMSKMILTMVGAAVVISMGGIFWGREIVGITFGSGYMETARILPWLFAALVFILPNTILTQGAIARNRESFYAAVAGIAALLNIGLNFLLIPEFGPLGAAWATIATEAFLTAGMMLNFRA